MCGSDEYWGAELFATTTSVGAESAEAIPSAFDAVTSTRSLEPTSAAWRTYVAFAAAAIAVQFAPALLQRRHS
jgi:hypothetical protein